MCLWLLIFSKCSDGAGEEGIFSVVRSRLSTLLTLLVVWYCSDSLSSYTFFPFNLLDFPSLWEV